MSRQIRQKIAILAKMYNAGGVAEKEWFVYFSYRDPRSNRMTRFKLYNGLNDSISVKGGQYKSVEGGLFSRHINHVAA